MTPASPKVFLYGYYGFGNVGDDLLLSSAISALSKYAPTACFVVRSLNPVASLSDERVQYVALEKLMTRVEWSRWRRLLCYGWETWRSLRGCSHLVFGGGTLFHARAGSSVNLALIAMLVAMARLRGAQVFALGVGVASLPPGIPQRLMRFILSQSRDFAVRDVSSLENCQCVFDGPQVRLTADLAFTLPQERLSRESGSRPILGITLAAGDIGCNGLGHEEFLAKLVVALERLRDRGWEIRFLSFQELEGDGIHLSDSALFATLYHYGLRESVEIVRVSSLPAEIPRQFMDIEVIAGMRFHGHVLAALLGIPFVGFGRDRKLVDLCALFSMPFFESGDLPPDRLTTAVEQVRIQVPNQQKTRALSQAAAENFSIVGASIS